MKAGVRQMSANGRSERKRALVLSGGGFFGAWQVGAWSVLRDYFQFDVVIGASVGSLNGWAIAGGATPEELAARWIEAGERGKTRFRMPRRMLDGLTDFSQMEGLIRGIHHDYQPKVEYHAVVTELALLKPKLIAAPDCTWRHLAASCALFGVLPQQRIDNVTYTDGGLLEALPLWAARDCGATNILGLNVMPKMPLAVRALLTPLRAVRSCGDVAAGPQMLVLSPREPLGAWKQAIVWQLARIPEWIEEGRRDARAAVAGAEARSTA